MARPTRSASTVAATTLAPFVFSRFSASTVDARMAQDFLIIDSSRGRFSAISPASTSSALSTLASLCAAPTTVSWTVWRMKDSPARAIFGFVSPIQPGMIFVASP